jgi:thioredoxin 1
MSYASEQPELAVIESIAGLTVLEFGTNWCGFCLRAQGDIAKGLSESKRLNHIKVEDGPGRPLGRSFRVKLWPTLIFLHEGVEVTRVVRPKDAQEVAQALAELVSDRLE